MAVVREVKKLVKKEPVIVAPTRISILTFGNILLFGVLALLVVIAFMLGALWQKVSFIEKNGNTRVGGVASDQVQAPSAKPGPLEAQKIDSLGLAPVTDKDHIQGPQDAKLTWVEYSDFECPFCKRIHPDIKKIMSEYGGQIRWVYRHFPLTSLHANAQKAAEAAECVTEIAGKDAFWKFTDAVFEAPIHDVTMPALVKIVTTLGINQNVFKTCVDSGKFADKVKADANSGASARVTGTPANFILDGRGNAYVVEGALPYDNLKQVVEKALGK